MSEKQPLLILGANSKVGKEIAIEFSKRDHDIILALRKSKRLENFSYEINKKYKNNIICKEFDILNKNIFEEFLKNLPFSPSIVISIIGLMNSNDKDVNYTTEQIINTNYLNQIIFFELVSRYLISKNKDTTIIALGSVAGERGRKKNYIYGSSKAGLHCYLSGLRQKYYRSKLNVVTIIPGYIDSQMLEEDIKKKSMSFLVSDPKKVAQIIYKAYKTKKSVVYTPFWRLIMFLIKIIPEYLFKKLSF